MIDIPDYQQISKNFAKELRNASLGQPSSIPFIKNPLPANPLVKPNQIFQAFVIGGTNGSVATIMSGENRKFTILDEKKFEPLPFFTTVDDFLSFIEANLDPQAIAIGINFAYNLIPLVGEHGELDGIMNQGDTKGHAFEGLQQHQVGKTIRDAIKSKLNREIITTVANDTVCLITSGLEENTDRNNLIAAIAGTGYNIAIFSDNNIAVNLQASDFTGFTQTQSGKIVDEQSKNPGEQIYNKEVAAGELYKHFNVLIPQLNLQTQPLQSSEGLLSLSMQENSQLSQVAKALFERSARLVAAQMAGIYEFKNISGKITCIIQGSLFKNENYLQVINDEMEKLNVPANTFEFKEIDKCDLLGAIKLVTG